MHTGGLIVVIECNQCLSPCLNPAQYSIQYFVIKFVSDLQQVDDFLRLLQFPPPIKVTATI